MDYMTKPLSRKAIRNIGKCIRKIFKVSEDKPFPVLQVLDKLSLFFHNAEYQVLEDNRLLPNVFAWCYQKPDGGFMIEIKQTVYDGAYNNNYTFLCFICHEICHIILFYLGFTPISTRTLDKNINIPAYRSVEWQAKALCGELTIPYEATANMNASEIVEKYHVSKQSAIYRVRQINGIKRLK